jgi:hypothetical protein
VRHPSDVLRVVLGALILQATMTAIHQDRIGVREANLFRLLDRDLATLLAALDGVADPTLVRAPPTRPSARACSTGKTSRMMSVVATKA